MARGRIVLLAAPLLAAGLCFALMEPSPERNPVPPAPEPLVSPATSPAPARIVARPRQPAPVAATPETPMPAAPLPRLSGIVVMQGFRQAIFTDADGRGSLEVGVGGRIDSFTVTAIEPGEAELVDREAGREPGREASRYTLRPSPHAGLRSEWAYQAPVVAFVDPSRREAETESDQ